MRLRFFAPLAVASLLFVGDLEAKLAKGGGPSSVEINIAVKLAPNIKAKSAAVGVADDGTNVVFTVPMGSLKEDPGPPGRHGAMMKFLEVEQFPQAELVVARQGLKLEGGSGSAAATLKFHGKAKPVTVAYVAERAGSQIKIKTSSFTFKMSDFGLEPPKLGPARVADDVAVSVEASLNDE